MKRNSKTFFISFISLLGIVIIFYWIYSNKETDEVITNNQQDMIDIVAPSKGPATRTKSAPIKSADEIRAEKAEAAIRNERYQLLKIDSQLTIYELQNLNFKEEIKILNQWSKVINGILENQNIENVSAAKAANEKLKKWRKRRFPSIRLRYLSDANKIAADMGISMDISLSGDKDKILIFISPLFNEDNVRTLQSTIGSDLEIMQFKEVKYKLHDDNVGATAKYKMNINNE